MGFEKIKRPVLVPGLAVHTPGSASTSPGSVAGDVDVADDVRVADAIAAVSATLTGAFRVATESITTTTVAQTVSGNGVSFVTYGTSGKPSDVLIPNPAAVGIHKVIAVVNNTTSVELNVNTASTANTFWGTTFNSAAISAASTGGPGGVPAGTVLLELWSQSTSQWALAAGSSFNWDLSASTGSTATA